MVNVRSRRKSVRGKSRLLLYLEMKDAIEKVRASGPVSFSRASSGCSYWLRPAANAPANISRHRKGLLSECADTNLLGKNTGNNQEDIDLRWNNMANGCLRAFLFEQNCDDAMGNANGTGANLTYDVAIRYYYQGTNLRDFAGDFNGDTSSVNIGNAADIQSLTELTIAFWTYCRSDGEVDAGRVLQKSANTLFETTYDNGTHVGLYGKIIYDGTSAESLKQYCLEKNEWHHVAFTYSQTGDRKIHIFIDGTEVTSYGTQTASVGNRLSDAAENGYIGNMSGGIRGYDGLITTFLIYNRVLTADEIKWLAGVADLRASEWELMAKVDATKVQHGMVSFQLDDEFLGQYNHLLPVFKAKGVAGYVCINVGLIGNGRMTASQIQEFLDAGFGLHSHSMTHTDPKDQNETDLRYEFSESKKQLEALFGRTVKHYSWPNNAPQSAYRAICAEYYDTAADGGLTTVASIPVLHSGHYTVLGSGILAYLESLVDEAYTNNYWKVFLYHDADAAMATELGQLIDYIKAKGMPILTKDQVLENMAFVPAKPLYGVYSVKCENLHATAAKQLYQVKTLTAADYIISFLAAEEGAWKGYCWSDLGQQFAQSYIYSLWCWENGVGLAGTATGGKILRSTDHGATWSDLGQQGGETYILSFFGWSNGIGLAGSGTGGKIFRSTNYGLNWTDLGQQAGANYIYAIAGWDNGIVLAGTGVTTGKILRSTNYGLTWIDLGQQFSQTIIRTIACFPGGIAIAGTNPNGKILRSTDYGATWTDLGQLGSETIINTSWAWPNGRACVGTGPNAKIYYTTDFGLTWIQANFPAANTNILTLFGWPDGTALAGTNLNAKILRSLDCGKTWVNISVAHATEGYVYSLYAWANGIALAGTRANGHILRSTINPTLCAVPFADTGGFTNEITVFNYEHIGGGVYWCWGKFTATAAAWNVGAEVKALRTVYLNLLTCVRAGTSMASGPYPRSPIANTSTGSATRQGDSLTVTGNNNFLPDKGTLDIEFYPLFPSNLPNAYQFYFAHFYGGEGQIRLYRDDANKLTFRMQSNGDDDSAVGTISWSRGDRVKIRVAWDCQEKLDGTNYILIYGKVNDNPWAVIGACPTQPTPPSSDKTLYVGRAGSSAGYEANFFISWLRIYDRPLLSPSW